MKLVIKWSKLVASVLLFFFCIHANGQYINVNPPGNIAEIDCDLYDPFLNRSETAVDMIKVGCEVYKIAVSNNSWSLYYDNCSGSSTFLNAGSFSNTMSNPDVVLIYDHYLNVGNVYAVIVYFDTNLLQYTVEAFDVTWASVTPIYSLPLWTGFSSVPVANDNAIRIDANSQGDFIIVWDDFENNKMYMLPGYVYGGNVPPELNSYIDYSTSEITLATVEILSSELMKPDIAISDSTEPKEAHVYLTSLEITGEKIFVDEFNLSSLWYTGPAWPSSYSAMSIARNEIYSNGYSAATIGRPRIAAPKRRDGETYVNDWTIAYSVLENNTSHIYGNSRYSGMDYPHNYTDNSEPELLASGGTVTFNDWQKNPALAYGFDEFDEVVAQIVWEGGWQESLSTQEGTDAPTIVAVSIDQLGAVEYNSCANGVSLYKMVPTDTPYDTYNPSIAGTTGEISEDMLVGWWNESQQNVFAKDFKWCDASYRKPIATNFQSNELLQKNVLYPNPTSGFVSLKLNSWKISEVGSVDIFDFTGRKIETLKGDKLSLERNIGKKVNLLRPGAYIISVQSSDGKIWTQKLLKQ